MQSVIALGKLLYCTTIPAISRCCCLSARPESQTSYQHLCELSKPSVLPVCALRTGWLLPFWMKPHKTSFIIGRWRLTVLYLNTDDFMVIADNGRVLGLGFIRAHLERRGKTVRWLWRAFIFSLQLRSSNLSGFSVEPLINYPPYTLNTHTCECVSDQDGATCLL